MDEDAKLSAMFTTLLETNWLMKERYRNGLSALFKDAGSLSELEAAKHVLKELVYCKSEDLILAGCEAASQIEGVNGWQLDPTNTLVVGVANGPKTCGSTAYLRCIETSLDRLWSVNAGIWTTIDAAFRKRQVTHKNLVIIDDFVGTGEKLIDLIGRLRRNPKTATYVIHVCAFASMEFGWEAVSSHVGGRFIANKVLQRCVSDRLSEPQRGDMLMAISSLERAFFSKPGEYSHGYKKSEASFYLEGYNIPNNNFPILWWDKYADGNQRSTLFARR
jgi:hypothetical protein